MNIDGWNGSCEDWLHGDEDGCCDIVEDEEEEEDSHVVH